MDDIQIIEKITKHDQEIQNVKSTLDRHETLLEKLEAQTSAIERLSYISEEQRKEQRKDIEDQRRTSEKISETLDAIKTTMSTMNVSLNNQIQEMERKIVVNQEEFRSDLKRADERINKTETKLSDLSEKGKFDFVSFIKDKAIPVLIGSGIAYFIINTIPK